MSRNNICRSTEQKTKGALGLWIDDSLPFLSTHITVDVEDSIICFALVDSLETIKQRTDICNATIEAQGSAVI